MPLYLSVQVRSNPEKVFRLNETHGQLVVGRAETADLRLDDAATSPRHALLRVKGSRVDLWDASSQGGTWVNGRQIRRQAGPYELFPGDQIHMGGVRLSVRGHPGLTAADWLDFTDCKRLLRFLPLRGHQRKLRLLACACCRQVWSELTDAASRQAVEMAERCADGLCTPVELGEARAAALAALTQVEAWAWTGADAASRTAEPCALEAVDWTLQRLPQVAPRTTGIARDLLGDFFHAIPVPEEWLDSNGGVVRKMAEAIYHNHDFGSMPILADALEEAGCADPVLLSHCRWPAPHYRGCWVLDTLLGLA